MNNVIIGTAGHIDHGKSALIRRLTGIEPDRWTEEKRRGITIDLGFAFFDLPSGKRAGVVDVPGHEKFVRNMLAGISGIDLVLLVVAADEGFMPQTKEHLDILTILEVQKGIVVLTKSDLVDEDMLELVKDDVKEHVAGTFLENAPVLPVSSLTGQGFEKLVFEIDSLVKNVQDKPKEKPPRLPIDRVFSLQGVGTVVTGTLVEGQISEEDQLVVYPQKKTVRIRKIQNHNESVPTAYAGQRIALNVVGVERDMLSRGDVIASDETMESTMMIDADLFLLPSAPRPISNWNRIRLYQGTKEVLCRVVLLDQEVLKPGQRGFVQLRLEEKTACKYGDRFVMRSYSPLVTIGGGTILDPNAAKHKRFKTSILDELEMKKLGDPYQIVESELLKSGTECLEVADIAVATSLSEDIISEKLFILNEESLAREILKGKWIHQDTLNSIEEDVLQNLGHYHEKNPLRGGMAKEELRKKCFGSMKGRVVDGLFDYLSGSGHIKIMGALVALSQFEVAWSPEQKQKVEKITDYFKKVGAKPPGATEAQEQLGIGKADRSLINALFDQGILIRISEKIWMSGEVVQDARECLIKYFEKNNDISVAIFRDIVETSRKNAMALLEYFDSEKLTKRQGDVRVLR